ncbi:MAG: DUF3008 family protein [Roseimicrobium sp.]
MPMRMVLMTCGDACPRVSPWRFSTVARHFLSLYFAASLPSRQMVKSMTEKQLEDFASTRRKKLPTRKK